MSRLAGGIEPSHYAVYESDTASLQQPMVLDLPDDVNMIRVGNNVSTNLAAVSVVIAAILAQEVVGLVVEGAVPARRDDEERRHVLVSSAR